MTHVGNLALIKFLVRKKGSEFSYYFKTNFGFNICKIALHKLFKKFEFNWIMIIYIIKD